MKKFLALCLLAALLVLALASCGGTEDGTPAGFKKASDDDACSYTLYVPDTWTVASGSTTDYTMATISTTDPCSVSVAVVSAVSASTVAEYWEDCQEEYGRLFDEFTPDAEGQGEVVSIGGGYGSRYFFNAKYGGAEYRYMQIFFTHMDSPFAGRLYILTYTASAEHFDAHYDNEQEQDVLAIISHFKFD